jgi:ribosomal protein S18 acetylase RimI-like enzyme
MTAPVRLRAVEEGDRAFLYRLYATTRADEIAAWGWADAQREAFLQLQFRAQQLHYQSQMPQAVHQIVCLDDQPIGRLILATDDEVITLADIALLPEYRNRGIGSGLIRDILATAAATGRRVRLHVAIHNPARRLYDRLGFRHLAQDGINYLMEASPDPQHYHNSGRS